MGIKDLLKFVKPYVEPVHIKKYAGQRVGIDAYTWLHKGAYSCSMELSLNMEGDKKLQYLKYFMHRIKMLLHYKITPVVVFDGGNLPCKAATQDERNKRRQENRDLAMEKLKEGNVAAASEFFQRGVSVSPLMAHQLIQILRSESIEFIVAPYEADAQLAYISCLEPENGGIVAVISEDSDLLVYSCPAVIFKMDQYGNGQEVILDNVFNSLSQVPSFRNFDRNLFTGMCVLAGCDFLQSVPGIGIVKAHGLVSKYRNLDRVLSILKLEKKSQVPENYSKSFREAVAVFQHARIYDAASKQLKHLKPIPEELFQCLDGELDFLGPEMTSSMATAVAEGHLNPCTMEAFDSLPSSKNHTNTTNIIRINQKQKREEALLPSTGGCFTTISSRNRRKEDSAKEDKKHFEEKFIDKDQELEKLLSLISKDKEESMTVIHYEEQKIPDNNPFKKRKLEEMRLDWNDTATESMSVVTEVEKPEIMSFTPDSQQSVDSKPVVMVQNDHTRRVVRSEKKAKKINQVSPLKKKTTILNFFSRV